MARRYDSRHNRVMANENQAYDAVLVGGGHNGLVCAAYLAKAGRKVLVLEKRDVVGGAAVTEEFHPGFRNSVAAYTVSLLQPKVIRDLDLPAHGLKVVLRKASNFLPLPDNRYLLDRRRTHEARSREVLASATRNVSTTTTAASMLIADELRALALQAPPNITNARPVSRDRRNAARRPDRQTSEETRRDACAPICSICSRSPPANISTASSKANRSRPCSVSTASSAISPVRTRRAVRTCCCITCSAK